MENLHVFKGFYRAAGGLVALMLIGWTLAGCDVFEDRYPEFISFRMDGTVGDTITVIYSKQFIAGANESGVTQVQVFGADTVVHTLPIDTIIDVRLEQRLFLRALPLPTDTVAVGARVDVDGRNLFDKAGDIFPGQPWQFLYQFNVPTTDVIEVVL